MLVQLRTVSSHTSFSFFAQLQTFLLRTALVHVSVQLLFTRADSFLFAKTFQLKYVGCVPGDACYVVGICSFSLTNCCKLSCIDNNALFCTVLQDSSCNATTFNALFRQFQAILYAFSMLSSGGFIFLCIFGKDVLICVPYCVS